MVKPYVFIFLHDITFEQLLLSSGVTEEELFEEFRKLTNMIIIHTITKI